jgi:XTP/dITP diphosphohydrolase
VSEIGNKRKSKMESERKTSVQSPIKLLIATGNAGKAREIAAVASPISHIQCCCLADLPSVEECEETGDTFLANAIQKACYYAQHFKCLTLADDSGLEVDALDGEPGIYSARYAGLPSNDQNNNDKLVRELAGVAMEDRTARFKCAMALVDADGNLLGNSEGTIEGIIIDKPAGENGFGYDPHFYLPERGKTTAQISSEEKNSISHRGQATRKMLEIIKMLINDGKI